MTYLNMIDNYIVAICKDIDQIQDQSMPRDKSNQDALILARALS